MASLSEVAIASISDSTASDSVMDDGRGFTTGGTNHAVPHEFRSPTRLLSASRKTTTTTSSRHRAFPRPLSAPVLDMGQEDLDLDLEDTLVAEDSVQSTLGSGQASGEKGGGGSRSREYLESTGAGASSSYSKAINKGMLDSHMVCVRWRSKGGSRW